MEGEGGVEGEAEHIAGIRGSPCSPPSPCRIVWGVECWSYQRYVEGGAIQAAQHGRAGGGAVVWVGCNRRQHGMPGDMIIRSHAIDAQDRWRWGLTPLLRGGVGLRLRRPLWC